MALPQCGGSPETGPLGQSSQAILGGTFVDAAESPFLYIEGPEGTCTGTLIAPTLVATARHCVAELSEGPFSCDASGNLIGGGVGGQIGIDNPPGAISFYLSSEVVPGQPLGAARGRRRAGDRARRVAPGGASPRPQPERDRPRGAEGNSAL